MISLLRICLYCLLKSTPRTRAPTERAFNCHTVVSVSVRLFCTLYHFSLPPLSLSHTRYSMRSSSSMNSMCVCVCMLFCVRISFAFVLFPLSPCALQCVYVYSWFRCFLRRRRSFDFLLQTTTCITLQLHHNHHPCLSYYSFL